MAEESQYLSFQGVRVHFCTSAPEDAPRQRVAILSSPLINTFHWRKIVPELIQLGCLVALIDLPGFGRSDCDGIVPQDHLLRAKMIWGILDVLDSDAGAPESMWHLAGHGTACATVLEMANLYPDSVKSQIHISPLLSSPDIFRSDPPARWYQDTVLAKDSFRKMIEHYAGYPMDDFIVDRMRAPLLRRGARESFLRMLRAGQKKPECDLGFCPAMALIGGRDAMIGDAEKADIEKYLGAAETHILKSAGHFPMETHSKALRDYLRGWIRYNA